MEELVEFSLQGQTMLLPKDFVLSHEWMLKTLLTTELGTCKTSTGSYYVNIDAPSFRLLVNFLNFGIEETTLENLGNFDLILLKKTAQYLGCQEILKKVLDIEGKKSDLIQDMENLKEENKYYEEKVKRLTLNFLNQTNLQCMVKTCEARRTHRSGNRCGNTRIVFQSKVHDCHNCSDLYLSEKIINNNTDFINSLKKLADNTRPSIWN